MDDGISVGCNMGCGGVSWRVEGACLTEASMSAVRQGARLVLPGADTIISVWRGFVGGPA